MTRARAAVAWLLLVPAGSVLLGVGVMLMAPGAVLLALGLLAWKQADRMLGLPKRDVGDDTVAMLADDDIAAMHRRLRREREDAYWRAWHSYLEHPSATGWAERRIRGDL